jgi:hypothetical protein
LLPVLESTERVIRIDIPKNLNSNLIKTLGTLEEISLKIWNIIGHLNYTNKEAVKFEFDKIAGKIKYFICLLLSIHALLMNIGKIRVVKCLLRGYYECIDSEDIEVAKLIKEYVEKYVIFLDSEKLIEEERGIYETLKIEFLMLDMHSSLINNNISMAKYYESKANLAVNCKIMKNENVFNLCRTIFNDGLQLYKDEKYHDAHYFLEKCYIILENMAINTNGPENKIKLSTLIMLTKCCIKLNTVESIENANKMIKLLHVNNDNKIEAFKLQLELLEVQNLNEEEIEDVIMKIIIGIPTNFENLKQIRVILNKFSDQKPTTAKNCLFYVFNNKLNFSNKNNELAESYLISLLWMVTAQIKDLETTKKLELVKNILEISDKKFINELSSDTLNCLIIMLWSMGKKKMKEENFNEAIEWFNCCFIRFFEFKGDKETIGKIQRSLLQCCLKINDFYKFETIYSNMDQSNKVNPISLYYQFSYLVKTQKDNDIDKNNKLADILTTLGELDNENTINLLALCIIESKESKINKFDEPLKMGIEKLINKCYKNETLSSQYHSLICVSIRACVFICSKSIEIDGNIKESVDLIVKCIDQFIAISKDKVKEADLNLINDIEWLASTCYNLGIKLFENVETLGFGEIKLFNSVLKLLEVQLVKDEGKFEKWKHKSILLKCLCQKKLIKKGNLQKNMWTEIHDDMERIIWSISDEIILFEVRMLNCESLVNQSKWNEVIKMIKQSNNDIMKDTNALGLIVDILIVKACSNQIKDDDSLKIREVLDIIFIEGVFKSESQTGKTFVFKLIYHLINKLIDDKRYEDMLRNYIFLFTELSNEEDDKIRDFELEWLSGMCWNKGIELYLLQQQLDQQKQQQVGEDSGFEESELDIDIISKDVEAETDVNLIRSDNYGYKWCELGVALAVGDVRKQMLALQERLAKEVNFGI